MKPARLAFPALRWRDDSGFDHESVHIDAALEMGVGGFILFGGEGAAVQEVISELRRRSSHPLLIGADLERGAGQQFSGCTSLPPAAALGSLNDPQTVWRAGCLTAREARALGVTWIFAPVADLSNEPLNPIVGTRAFARDPEVAARCTTAWVMGCLEGGALPCVKHFPGHGRTRSDSHVELPVVETGFEDLSRDLLPFAAAIRAGAPSVMTAHVAYPVLDPTGSPATRSRPIVSDLLRGELGFEGLVVSDAMIMEGALAGVAEGEAAVAAVCAGVDVVLYPNDPGEVAAALSRALDDGRLSEVRALEAERRVAEMAERAGEYGGEGGELEKENR